MLIAGQITLSHPYNIHSLKCELGEIAIEDKRLEVHKAGRYSGFFDIERLVSRFYSKPQEEQTVTSKVFAILKNYALLPIDTSAPVLPPAAAPSSASAVREADGFNAESDSTALPLTTAETDENEEEAANDAALFSEYWPLQETVKFDSAHVRTPLFAKRRERLKALGYHFDHTAQAWHKVS